MDRADEISGAAALQLNWVRVGVVAGLVAVASYTFLVVGWGDSRVALLVAASFGISLGLAAYGLYQFLTVGRRPSVITQTAMVATLVGAAVFIAMATVQLSVRADLSGTDPTKLGEVFRLVDRVQLALDVVWDLFFSVGMALFAVAAYSHPRLGRVIGASGLLVALALLVLNVVAFPTPPASAGSVDLGPVAGLWYLVITIMILRSLGWANERLTGTLDA